jgi:hypothetical protein
MILEEVISIDTFRWIVGGLLILILSIATWYMNYLHGKINKMELEIVTITKENAATEIRFTKIESKLEQIFRIQEESQVRGKEMKSILIEIKDALLRKNIL